MSNAEALAQYLNASRRAVVFTGAGISTESGIPDFRSPGGVWTKMQPIMFQDFVRSREARAEAWSRVFNRTAGWTGAAPNAGHHAVAALVKSGKVRSVITQNVDNLHLESGVPEAQIIELHGNAAYAKCLDCGERHELGDLEPRWKAGAELVCLACDGLLKTATISFGQPMPEDKMERATDESIACDLMLVLGSSLVVRPACGLPLIAKEAGAKLVIVNREATPLDGLADLVLHDEIGPLMTKTLTLIA
ncbi:SIR2 family NAD-dependent protein deacylase [Terricaulis sp.]|uniref:SIR2 family NAD-dependent protein deacylase n=1 Tax=Terricaulis sp. TaxID=2768686 RepID=UPI003784F3A6